MAGTVVGLRTPSCGGSERCLVATFRADEGNLEGLRSEQIFGALGLSPVLEVGDPVRLQPLPPAARASSGTLFTFTSVDRRKPIVWLAVVFGVLVVLLARLRGLLALVGFGLSLTLVTTFVVPAILAGRDPVLVALVGSLAVMWVTLLLTYGIGPRTLAASLGIALSPRSAPSSPAHGCPSRRSTGDRVSSRGSCRPPRRGR